MEKRKENKNSIQIQFQQVANTNTRTKIEENNLIPQWYKKNVKHTNDIDKNA